MTNPDESFSAQSREKQPSLIAEVVHLLLHTKKWWLAPLIVVLLIMSVLIVLGSTSAGPFIYSLF
ncbi:MAG TPA: DUF5989 family protein [Opitutaceae bacterium]|nr:DUF5989 family protein [Opitutaceae bacterium]